ncbi:MAG: hypothetical protein ACPGJS_07065 [Flammeovirgaceae bacterium]
MKMLKSLAGGIIATLLLFLIVGLFLPSNYEVSSNLSIPAPTNEVFEQINTLTNWQHWAFEDSSAMTNLRFEGPAEGVGALYTWHDEYSTGRMEITASVPNQQVSLNLISNYGEQETELIFKFINTDGGTTVTWVQKGDVGYDIRARFFIAIGGLGSTLGKQNLRALERLKTHLSTKN